MTLTTLLPFLMLLALAWLWLDGARAREFATTLARRYCGHRGLQFLDETVALARVGLRWTNGGLRIRRMYRFEYSLEGAGRRTGFVLMLGSQLETIDAGLPRASEQAPVEVVRDETPGKPEPPPADKERKVIPFRRKDQ